MVRGFVDDFGQHWVARDDHKQALAEKDLQWKRRVGLDCGGHSCFYAIDKAGMRHNGPCSCNPKRTKEDHDRLYAAYQQLMEQAVGLAETVLQGHRHRLKTLRIIRANASITLADNLLNSPEVQAFLKEREGT